MLRDQLPLERIGSAYSPPNSYLDLPSEKVPKVFVKGSEDLKVYILKSPGIEKCETTVVDRTPVVERKCYTQRKYVPLKERTKRWEDLVEHDSADNRQSVEKINQKYEERRQKIRAERIRNLDQLHTLRSDNKK